MSSRQSVEDQRVQASYEALEQATDLVSDALPGFHVDYESPPGFIWINLGDSRGVAFGLVDEFFGANLQRLDADGNDVGINLGGISTTLSSTNDDPRRFADVILGVVATLTQHGPAKV